MTGDGNLKRLIDLIIRGGWPASIGMPAAQAALLPEEYLNAVIDDDVYRMDSIRRNTIKMRLLLRSLARNESTTATNKRLKNDIREVDDEDIDVETVKEYLDIFERLFIIENQPPFLRWHAVIHSGEAGGKTPFLRSFSGMFFAQSDAGQPVGRFGDFGLSVRSPVRTGSAHLCGVFRRGAVSLSGLPKSGNRRGRGAFGWAMVRL